MPPVRGSYAQALAFVWCPSWQALRGARLRAGFFDQSVTQILSTHQSFHMSWLILSKVSWLSQESWPYNGLKFIAPCMILDLSFHGDTSLFLNTSRTLRWCRCLLSSFGLKSRVVFQYGWLLAIALFCFHISLKELSWSISALLVQLIVPR